MNRILKKTMAIILLVAIIVANMPIYVIAATDTTSPSVVISGISSNTVVEEGNAISFIVYFSDETAMGTVNMTSNHVALVGFTGYVSVSGSGYTRTVTISNISDITGTNSVMLRAGAATDAAGNRTAVTTVSGFSIVEPEDYTRPSVVVSSPSSKAVTEGGTVKYDVTFSDETAMGTVSMTSNHVVLNGFDADITVSGSGNTRTVTLTNVQGVGADNTITIRAGAAKDAAGNTTAVATSGGFSITAKDTTKPSVVISKANPTTVVEGGTVKYDVTFSDETAMGTVNMTANHVVLNGFDADITVSGSGNTRTVTLTNVQGVGADNTITIRAGAAKDAAGNTTAVTESSTFTVKAVVKDTTKPSIVISKANPTTVVEGGTVKYDVVFSDETAMGTVNMTSNHVVLNGFDADITVSGSGNTRTVTLTNVQGVGADNTITIRAGAAKDAAGNTTAVATSGTFSIKAKDTTRPSVVISKANPTTVVEGGTVKYDVTFSDETAMGTVSMTSNHVALSGFTANISVSGEGNTRTVTLTNIQGAADADNKIIIRAGAATDAAGNTTAVTESSTFTVKAVVKDTTKPSIVISKANPTTVVEGGTVKYDVVFSDETAMGTVSMTANHVVLNGFDADITVSGSGNTRTVTLTNVQGVGADNTITIRAGAATDAAGNKTAVTTSGTFSIKAKDTTRPSVVISKANPTTVVEGGTVKYDVVFSDETAMGTVNMTSNHVALIGFDADITVSGSGNTRTVTLTNVQGAADSDNKIIIRAGAAKDATGNTTVATESSTFTIKAAAKDTTRPSVVISNPSPTVIEVGGTVSYTVIFSDETAMGTVNMTSNHVMLSGFDANISVTGTGNTRVITLTNVQSAADSDNKIIIRAGAANDAAGNTTSVAESSNFAVTVPQVKDVTAPSVVISKADPAIVVEGGTVKYIVVFSDETAMGTVNMTSNHVALIGFEADINVSGSGYTRTVTLTNIKGVADADNRIVIRAGAATDAAGNKTAVTESSNFVIKAAVKDTTRPSVVVSKPSPSVIKVGETVKYIVTFSDETAMGVINFNKNYVELVGFTANIIVTGSGNTKTITLTNVQGAIDSDNRIIIKAGAATDAAGNTTVATESSNFTVKATEVKDSVAPVVKIESVKPSKVYVNGTVKYTVTFSDNIAVTDVKLYASKITTVGFKADVSVEVNGTKSAEITLKNIKGTIGKNKYIKIASGVALDAEGNRSAEVTSMKFSIINNSSTTPTIKPVVETVYKPNCIDDIELLGNINKEITYFASWLRAEKYTATYPQENNYVVEDDTMTYMIEYFNGSTAPAPDVKFELTIPYNVSVEEINGGGKITKQTDKETVITWDMGIVKSYVESKGTGFCRLYVRVKFAENKALEESNNISEVFYATLKTTAGGNESYSYMRQLFIDLTEGKTGTYTKYLTSIDSTNQVRPNDEITRAEFAKLLADAGIIEVEIGSKEYKTFKDYEAIPSYARDAVSALAKANIIQAFADGTFKPNNPILVEDVMQMIAQAATYVSEQKLTVNKPVFLYTEALTGKDGEISPKKDYIMELMRQNVIAKTDSKPDTYALRKDVVAMVNSLTFRGPYVETLPENTLKFADIREDSVVFYNIVGAANSYDYTYDYRLWQQIIDVK